MNIKLNSGIFKNTFSIVVLLILIILGCFFFTNQANAAYRDVVESESNLLYYWPMDEAVGATSLTAAVGGTAINITGATAGESGQIDGTAVSFNGTSNYGVTASSLNLTAYNKIIVEALVYIPSYDSTGRIIWESSINMSNGTDGFMFAIDGGINMSSALSNVALKGDVGYNLATYTRPSSGSWHHVVAVYDKSLATNEVDFYIDGVLQSATRPYNTNSTNLFGNNVLYLMSRAGTSLFTSGKIQHLAIYSNLSEANILSHSQTAFYVAPAFTGGTLSESYHSSSTATLSWTSSSNGTAPIVDQLQISAHSANSWSNISSGTTSPLTVSGLEPDTSYDFRVLYTDNVAEAVYSNTVTITTNLASDVPYSQTVTNEPNLLYYWKMNDSSGATSLAATVGGTAINLTGATTGTTGKIGTAASFNGTSNFGATSSSLNLTAYNKIAVEALVYFNSYDSTYRQAWELGPSAVNTGFGFAYEGGVGTGTTSNIFLNGNVGYSLALYSRPSVAAWHHVVVVYDKSLTTNEVDFYIDGVLQSGTRSYNFNNTNNFGNQVFYLMSRGGSQSYGNGKMQHLAIYSDLGEARILAHSNLMNTAQSVTVTGPTSGFNGSSSSNFSVSSDLPVASSVIVTPSDSGAGGTFTPSSVTISSETPTVTFVYTPNSTGSKVISFTNDGGLSNPSSLTYVVTTNVPATTILLSGPSSGSINTNSTNFTVSTDGVISGSLIITPSDGEAGGTFTPTSVTLSSSVSADDFIYLPSSLGSKTISITNNQGLINPNDIDYSVYMVGSGLVLGDSTVATYAGGTQIADFIYTTSQVSDGWTITNIAVPGHTIAQQKTVYLSTGNRSTVDYTIVQIGLNDLNPAETSSVAVARLQDLINTINSNKKSGSLTIISTMNPCRERLIDIYGATNGPISYQKFLDINEAIRGNGSTPITGVDYRISNHTSLLNDGVGNLASIYDTGDHIHENNAARQIIARVWRDSLAELELLNPDVSSAPIIGTATANDDGSISVSFTPPQFNGGRTVTSYTVTSSPGDIVANGSVSPIVVSGLSSGESYTFSVAANNGIGLSDSSSSTSSIASADIISPLTPVALPLAKTYNSTQSVSLTADGSSSIRYSTVGIPADCMSGTLYNGPIEVSRSETIYVRACDTANNYSTASFNYTISNYKNKTTGSSVSVQINNLMATGNIEAAQGLQNKFPNQITSINTSNITKLLKMTKSITVDTEVKILQLYLKNHGYTLSVDGLFGPKTKSDVILFQKANNLTPDGIVGPKTREMMK